MYILRKVLLAIVLSFPFYIIPSEEKKIRLKNGISIQGIITEETDIYIRIKTKGGVEGKLEKRFIENVFDEVPEFPKETKSVLTDAENTDYILESVQKKEEESLKLQPEELPPFIEIPPKESKNESLETSLENGKADAVLPSEIKYHTLEFYAGIGPGTYQSPGAKFTDRYQDIEVGITDQTISSPIRNKSNEDLSNSFGLNYYWKKISVSLEYHQYRGTTNHQNFGYFPDFSSGPLVPVPFSTRGNLPENQNISKGDLAYLIYSNSIIKVRPLIGMIQSYGNINDHNTLFTVYNYGTSRLPYSGIQDGNISEVMKGLITGLKLSFPINYRWEIRLESYFLSLSGNRSYNAVTPATVYQPDLVTSGEPTSLISVLFEKVKWRAKGQYYGIKIFYHFNSGLSIWIGADSFSWQYKLDTLSNFSTNRELTFAAEINRQGLVNLIAKSDSPSSRSQSVEIGLMKRFEF
ncbi:hypothetical protein [Leptospira saintgironsiae]|uniref:Uncharacterized protein n=1 Tax=Leptospira saintgironsiae TaxID=2023183 RepID=A0A2M9Y9R2_9LEPT|nr:hypothetical protein [Leptospira saintgironsiae]PJZ48310.1 hypothetical protein CH362_13910 [Leptospira saintgironsiae]